MVLKKLVRNVDGQFEATWVITQEQMSVLLWYAVADLIGKGLANVVELNEAQFEELKQEFEKKQQAELLASMDTSKLPRA